MTEAQADQMDTTTGDVKKEEIKMDYTPKPESVDISKAKDGKLWKEVISAGEGDEQPDEGMEVIVHYTGKLSDGTVFDSSVSRNEPFKFTLGQGSVIQGWEEGIASMKKNEKALLVIHPDYGYGSTAQGAIPANSTLYFEVQLLDWKEEDLTKTSTGGITRKKLYTSSEVSKFSTPNEGATVTVHLEGQHEGGVFDKRDLEFCLGEGIDLNVPVGIEKALLKMVDKEKSRITLQPKYGFGSAGNSTLGVPPNAVLTYIVELKGFTKAKEAWQLNGAEKLECSREFKAKGTKYFSEGKHRLAAAQYKKIVDFLKSEALLEGAEEEERKSLLLASYLNQAICSLKLDDFVGAKNNAEQGLELDPKNVKGHFRLGLANLGLNEPELAKSNFQTVLSLEPGNKSASQQIAICNQQIKLHKEKEKQLFGKMFDKFAKIDTKKEEQALKKQPNGLDNLDEWQKTGTEDNNEQSEPALEETEA